MNRAAAAAALVGLLAVTPAWAAPPRMMESQPSARTLITGPHIAYVVRFDVPVDHASARLQVVHDGAVIAVLRPRLDSAPEVLYAGGPTPPAGAYVLRWQVQGRNGEASDGEIPFSTQP